MTKDFPVNANRVEPLLLQRLGERIAATCSQALAAGSDAAATATALAPLEQLGLQLQSLARVLAGRGQQSPERIDLGMAMLQLRAEWAGELQRRGASVGGPIEPIEVRMCAGVLKQLLDLALAHALALGPHVEAAARRAGDPPLPTLELHVRLPPGELFGASAEALNELHWPLLTTLADAEGLRLERRVEGRQVVLALGLPPSD